MKDHTWKRTWGNRRKLGTHCHHQNHSREQLIVDPNVITAEAWTDRSLHPLTLDFRMPPPHNCQSCLWRLCCLKFYHLPRSCPHLCFCVSFSWFPAVPVSFCPQVVFLHLCVWLVEPKAHVHALFSTKAEKSSTKCLPFIVSYVNFSVESLVTCTVSPVYFSQGLWSIGPTFPISF